MYYRYETGNYNPTLRDLDMAGVQIFNDWWDTYIPEYKPVLIRKIMHTYYFEQIGAETPEQFVHYINAHLERIMPYYNQLYASELIKINPMLNHSIEVNGRTIENLLSKANTTDDKFAKAIRDFAGITDRSGAQGTTATSTTLQNRKDHTTDEYQKSGTEDITDKRKTIGTEDETDHETKVTNGTTDTTEGEKTTVSDTRNLDKTVTERPGETVTTTTDWGQTQKGTEKVVGKDVADGTGSKDWTETRDDDSTTKTVTDLDETSTGNGEKDYADTPQKQLDVTSEYGTAHVRRDFLTNVTWTNDSSKHNADTTQDVTFTDDETKTHKENTTDKTTTDKTQDTETNTEKGGTDTETKERSGENITETSETEYTDREQDRNLTSHTGQNQTVTTDGTRDIDTTENEDYTRDKDWTEKGSSTSDLTSDTNSNTNSATDVQSTSTDQTHENSNMTQSTLSTQNKESEETTDTGSTTITSGFMNVSSSALLEAFRKTFINIDSMIIEELRDNFMLVY